jgi:hypothetical protein
MKATIRDVEALRAIRPTDLMTYLRATGWELSSESEKAAYWEKTTEGATTFELLVPLRKDFGDFASRINEALETLETVETRSQLEIFSDLVTASADVIRVRTHSRDGEDQGSLSLEDGVIAHERVRELVLAAACATISPRALFAKRKPERAMSYLRRVRLGQTERGSYVFTLISPVPPALRDATLIATEEPFERRVVETLAGALNATRQAAVVSAVRGGDMEPFKSAIAQGVSANLFEAISGLSEASGDQPLDFHFAWARSRLPTTRFPFRIGLTPDIIPAITEAARVFRATEPLPDFELVGSVVALRREEGASSGSVTVVCPVEGKMRRVLIELPDPFYHEAVKAHDEQGVLLCYGDLEREGRSYVLRNPHDLMAFPDPNAQDDFRDYTPHHE